MLKKIINQIRKKFFFCANWIERDQQARRKKYEFQDKEYKETGNTERRRIVQKRKALEMKNNREISRLI